MGLKYFLRCTVTYKPHSSVSAADRSHEHVRHLLLKLENIFVALSWRCFAVRWQCVPNTQNQGDKTIITAYKTSYKRQKKVSRYVLWIARFFYVYGHILRRNCLLQQVIEGKIKGKIEVTGKRGRRGSYWMTLRKGEDTLIWRRKL
jgi:hypothetical protein